MLNPTPSLPDACANTHSTLVQEPPILESLPIVEGRGVSIHPADNNVPPMIHPSFHGPDGYALPSGSFNAGFFESLNPYLSLPNSIEYNLPILPPFPSQNSPDMPITAWNKNMDASRIPIFSPPHFRSAFACATSQSPSHGLRMPSDSHVAPAALMSVVPIVPAVPMPLITHKSAPPLPASTSILPHLLQPLSTPAPPAADEAHISNVSTSIVESEGTTETLEPFDNILNQSFHYWECFKEISQVSHVKKDV
ncbi:hypothetical protein BDR06DRAFT_1002529 [Suillus hirtellus]|nr:hypothetical protein BDR06DRAFT_1002529 [Suillus hirtellus]